MIKDYNTLIFGIIFITFSIIMYLFRDRYLNFLAKKNSNSDFSKKRTKTSIGIGVIGSLFMGLMLVYFSFN